ncbi:MAG TPA: hypothetical protein VJ997_02245 [Longimicrobiales bacterium]|nr:hypothetical protein [Longimicrobiales bacterium]
MRSKPLHAVLLAIAVVLDAGILFSVTSPWMRLVLGLFLLVVIMSMASALKLRWLLGDLARVTARPRHFLLLRKSVTALLDEVRRLNWLVVDLDRGFRNREVVQAEIESTEGRMAELLREIRQNAGKQEEGIDEDADTDPRPTPAVPVGEPPQETGRG